MEVTKNSESEEWWVGYAFTINSIIGSGILAIPGAYAESGWLLGLISQLIISILAFFLCYQVLQA
jgi:Transmembrane amino acid transporter protein.